VGRAGLCDREEHSNGEHGALALAIRWLETYGQIAKAQNTTRNPFGVNSTGPVEQTLHEIDRRIGDRIGSFTSRARLAKLLDLMTLDMRGQADGRAWATTSANGSTSPAGAPPTNAPRRPKGVHSLFL
jgi:hypothetical protein